MNVLGAAVHKLGGAPWSAMLPLCFTCFNVPIWKA